MEKKHWGQHGPECFGCKIQDIFIGDPYDFPSRTPSKTPPALPKNSWERGIARDHRGVPLIKGDLSEVSVKEHSEKRHSIEENKRRFVHEARSSTPKE